MAPNKIAAVFASHLHLVEINNGTKRALKRITTGYLHLVEINKGTKPLTRPYRVVHLHLVEINIGTKHFYFTDKSLIYT